MKTITALKIQKRDKNKVNVFLDNTYFCSLSLEIVIKNSLKPNMMIDEKVIEKWQMESEKVFAYEQVLKLINTRFKTKKEIENYLKEKGYLPATIYYVVSKLLEYNLIDDKRYAESFVSCHCEKDGVNKIKQKLLQKGISEEIIDNALSNVNNQTESILLLKQKYMKNKEDTNENKLKLMRYLINKGFKYEDIKEALKGEN